MDVDKLIGLTRDQERCLSLGCAIACSLACESLLLSNGLGVDGRKGKGESEDCGMVKRGDLRTDSEGRREREMVESQPT